MLDLVTLSLRAGDGGMGRVSFRREKYVPKGGPDGGDGGRGGSIYLVGDAHLSTLKHFAGVKEIRAKHGESGGKRQSTGAKGEDIEVKVPLGTSVWVIRETVLARRRRETVGLEEPLKKDGIRFVRYELEKEGQSATPPEPEELEIGEFFRSGAFAETESEREKVLEITADGQRVLLCQGGYGGRGNMAFKGSTNTTPLVAEHGSPGEHRVVFFELKLLADVGLIGLPNAGKSTLLSVVTKASPKIANYPFTTLEPHLGVLSLSDSRELVLADIPGLVAGASEGKGLGLDFLRHIENCAVLLFVLFLDESIGFNLDMQPEDQAQMIWEQLQQLRAELSQYGNDLAQKPRLTVVNKIDLLPEETLAAIAALFASKGEQLEYMSGVTGAGLAELTEKIWHLVQAHRAARHEHAPE